MNVPMPQELVDTLRFIGRDERYIDIDTMDAMLCLHQDRLQEEHDSHVDMPWLQWVEHVNRENNRWEFTRNWMVRLLDEVEGR